MGPISSSSQLSPDPFHSRLSLSLLCLNNSTGSLNLLCLNNSTGSFNLLCLNNSPDSRLNLRSDSLSPSLSRPDLKLPDSLFLRDNNPSQLCHQLLSSKRQVTFSKTLSSRSL